MQQKAQKQQNAAQRELAEYQYNKNVEMWNMQNAYNSPVEQMKRFQEAGLNPNLIYGSTSSSGNATSMPTYDAPTLQTENGLSTSLGIGFNQAIQTAVSLAKLRNETAMNRAQIDTARSQQNYLNVQSMVQETNRTLNLAKKMGVDLDNDLKAGLMNDTLALMRQKLHNEWQQTEATRLRNRQALWEFTNINPYTKAKNYYSLQESRKRLREYDQKYEMNAISKQILGKDYDTYDSRFGLDLGKGYTGIFGNIMSGLAPILRLFK